MAQTSHLKSAAITNLDGANGVITAVQAGNGAAGYVRKVQGYVTALNMDSIGTTYQLVRIPTNARDLSVWFHSEAQGGGKVQLSVYYSDSPYDGTPVAVQGLAVPTSGAGFFSDDIDCTSIVDGNYTSVGTSGIGANGYTLDKRGKELWDALGLTSDPGGKFDIVAVVHTTAITTGTGKLGVDVSFV